MTSTFPVKFMDISFNISIIQNMGKTKTSMKKIDTEITMVRWSLLFMTFLAVIIFSKLRMFFSLIFNPVPFNPKTFLIEQVLHKICWKRNVISYYIIFHYNVQLIKIQDENK